MRGALKAQMTLQIISKGKTADIDVALHTKLKSQATIKKI